MMSGEHDHCGGKYYFLNIRVTNVSPIFTEYKTTNWAWGMISCNQENKFFNKLIAEHTHFNITKIFPACMDKDDIRWLLSNRNSKTFSGFIVFFQIQWIPGDF